MGWGRLGDPWVGKAATGGGPAYLSSSLQSMWANEGGVRELRGSCGGRGVALGRRGGGKRPAQGVQPTACTLALWWLKICNDRGDILGVSGGEVRGVFGGWGGHGDGWMDGWQAFRGSHPKDAGSWL